MKSQSHHSFIDLQHEAFKAVNNKDFRGFGELIELIENRYPQKKYKTVMWKMCHLATTSKKEQAFKAGFKGLEDGFWWNPDGVRNEPGLNPLKEDPRFDDFVQACEEAYEREKSAHQPALCTIGNPQSSKRLFSIHWRGDNAEDFAENWEELSILNNWHIGFPQSSQAYGHSRFCWDDPAIAIHDLQEAHAAFDEISVSESSRTILSGASQGGKLAIDLALKWQPFSYPHFFAIVPSIKDLGSYEEMLKEGVSTKVKGYIVTGEKDPFLQQTRALHELFLDYDIPCQFVVIEGMGHYFPKNFSTIAAEAVSFLR
ncbi:alpha/beta hydrolase [Alteribacter populi]|uniref:alpha/beta hydrolase n=1 Tax=Alteribacter populi TaxID=2011011 RepID=UPI000BBA7768|nr:hypothetical protein [Alteribacter populi]